VIPSRRGPLPPGSRPPVYYHDIICSCSCCCCVWKVESRGQKWQLGQSLGTLLRQKWLECMRKWINYRGSTGGDTTYLVARAAGKSSFMCGRATILETCKARAYSTSRLHLVLGRWCSCWETSRSCYRGMESTCNHVKNLAV